MISAFLWMPLVITAAIGALGVRWIPQGQAYVLRRPGGHTRALSSGLRFSMPLLERMTRKISLTGNCIVLDALPLAEDSVDARVYYQVLEPARAVAVIDQLEDILRRHATQAVQECAPVETARLAPPIRQQLNEQLQPHGVLVTRVELRSSGMSHWRGA